MYASGLCDSLIVGMMVSPYWRLPYESLRKIRSIFMSPLFTCTYCKEEL